MAAAVNTANTPGFRVLRFTTIGDAMAEIDRIVAADQAGKLIHTGNWTAGQVFGHIASWIEYGYVGYPMKPPPWIIRVMLRMRVKKYLRDGMPRGVRIPGVENGTFGIEPLSTAEGADRLRRAFLRLKNGELAVHDSPAFGPMSHPDRIELNLRHAELHLGFLRF